MADGAAEVVYSIDTNSLMDWQARYYPVDVFASLVARVDALVLAGRLIAAQLVHEEVEAVGTAGLIAWVKTNKGIFVPTRTILAGALAIQNQFTGLRDPKAEFEEADAYVIALAQQRSGIVVTQETPAAEKQRPRRTHFIPDVCRELGVPCISLLGLMRREKWTL
jgi:anti-sigma factor RsiW